MRWLFISFILLCSCTAYKHNLNEDAIARKEIEKIEVDDKVLLVLLEEVDERKYLRGRFKSFSNENIIISNKTNGIRKTTSISLSNIKKIKFDESVPLTILKVGLGISGSVLIVALISFLSNPNIGAI